MDFQAANQKLPWDMLDEFVEAFTEEFFPVAEAQEAMVRLEGKEYFQKQNV